MIVWVVHLSFINTQLLILCKNMSYWAIGFPNHPTHKKNSRFKAQTKKKTKWVTTLIASHCRATSFHAYGWWEVYLSVSDNMTKPINKYISDMIYHFPMVIHTCIDHDTHCLLSLCMLRGNLTVLTYLDNSAQPKTMLCFLIDYICDILSSRFFPNT